MNQNDPAQPPPDAEASANTSLPIEDQLREERAKAERYLANWQRAQADFVNYKRRQESEREEVGRLANAALIINLLPIADDLERALASVDTKLAGLTWIDGVRLIQRKLQGVLEASGVREIPAEGHAFDPNVHEAIMYEEGEDGKVVKEVQRGYRLGDRVIRPSLVVVGRRGAGEGTVGDGPIEGPH